MSKSQIITIPARRGKAAVIKEGQSFQVINTHGSQVVDTWAFNADDLSEFQSNEHTRPTLLNMTFKPGDCLYTNRRRPFWKSVADNSGGVHDLLMAACDNYRYQLLGCTEYHDNCQDNLVAAMKEVGLATPEIPSPMNLFMNIPWTPTGELAWEAPVSSSGDYIQFKALMDCVIAFSACPQDILPINGVNRKPTEAHFRVL